MAKTKSNSPTWQDWAIFVLIVVAVFTNVYWYWAVRGVNKRLDAQTVNIYELSTKAAK